MIETPDKLGTLQASSNHEASNQKFLFASIYNGSALKKSAELAKEGMPIGLFNRGVCAILGDGASDRFVERVRDMKGEKRGDRPLAATLGTERLLEIVDTTKIPFSLHKIFTDAHELSSRIGSLCFIRVPITHDAAKKIPESMLSYLESGTAVIQNWDPYGHKPASNLLREMHSVGIEYPAITSMNISGKPEIVNQTEGCSFSVKNGIPVFLYDYSKGDVKGSYTIFDISLSKGVQLVRDGNIPSHLFPKIFETEIDTTQAKKSNHPQMPFPHELIEGLSPSKARIAIISYANGDKNSIHRFLKKEQSTK